MLWRRNTQAKQARELARLIAALDTMGADQRASRPARRVRVAFGAAARAA